MYYKVIYKGKVIDVLDNLVYLRYQPKHNRMIFCEESAAQAIFSSNMQHIWHVSGLEEIPTKEYDTVTLQPIDKYEYFELKNKNAATASVNEIIDNFILMLINKDVKQLTEALSRLLVSRKIDEQQLKEICEKFSISVKNIYGN